MANFRISAEDTLHIESGSFLKQGSQAPFLTTGIGGSPTHIKVQPDGRFGVQIGSAEGPLDVYHSADSRFIVKENGDLEIIGSIYNDGIQTLRECVELADDAIITLPTSTSGWGTVIVGNHLVHAYFRWDTSANITLIEYTSNVVTTDTDNKFCIYGNSNAVRLKNRLGLTLTVCFEANCALVTATI